MVSANLALIMSRKPRNPGTWPHLMRAETAAAFCDEVSVEAFMRRVGSLYSRPVYVAGWRYGLLLEPDQTRSRSWVHVPR